MDVSGNENHVLFRFVEKSLVKSMNVFANLFLYYTLVSATDGLLSIFSHFIVYTQFVQCYFCYLRLSDFPCEKKPAAYYRITLTFFTFYS